MKVGLNKYTYLLNVCNGLYFFYFPCQFVNESHSIFKSYNCALSDRNVEILSPYPLYQIYQISTGILTNDMIAENRACF